MVYIFSTNEAVLGLLVVALCFELCCSLDKLSCISQVRNRLYIKGQNKLTCIKVIPCYYNGKIVFGVCF